MPQQHEFVEARRLAALHALQLLDTAPEREFDALTALAAELLGCPTAMLTLIDSDRQWVKSGFNAPFDQSTRDAAFCDRTIRGEGVMVVPDVARDPRFAGNPLAAAHDIQFYAGLPIHADDADGTARPIGALCVVDNRPRSLTPAGEQALRHLARLAEALISARATALQALRLAEESERQAAQLRRQERLMLQAERMAMIGSWRYDLASATLTWSDNVYRIHDIPRGEQPPLDRALDFYPPEERDAVRAMLDRLIADGGTADVEADFITAKGRRRRVRSMAEREMRDGMPTAIIGVFQDITDQHEVEQSLRRSADRDALTGLANRAAFNRALEAAVDRARAGAPLLLAMIDLDNFKTVNDTFGHLAGDEVLQAMAARLTQPWLGNSIAARLGGDEFALIVTDPAVVRDPAFAARLQDQLHVSSTGDGLSIATSGSVGAIRYEAGEDMRDFVHRADTLLYATKRQRVGDRRRGERRQAARA